MCVETKMSENSTTQRSRAENMELVFATMAKSEWLELLDSNRRLLQASKWRQIKAVWTPAVRWKLASLCKVCLMQLRRKRRISLVPRARSTAGIRSAICRTAISMLPPTAASILVWWTAQSAFPFYVIIAAHTYAWQAILFCFCSFY